MYKYRRVTLIIIVSFVWLVIFLFMRLWANKINESFSHIRHQNDITDSLFDHAIVETSRDNVLYKHIEHEHTMIQQIKNAQTGKMNAVFVILVRNSELEKWLSSMRELEDRFNREYNYPYVFLNEQNFTQEFKDQVQSHTKAKVEFGLIPKEHWGYPDFIDQDRAKKNREESKGKMDYGDSESYRHMCWYESGFFFRHLLLQKYEWYWRVEPDVHFLCDIDFDPFQYLAENNKKYGFTIAMKESINTIPTLWQTVKDYINENSLQNKMPPDNSLRFLSWNGGRDYNGCHFWTNFEIASFDIWRDQSYLDYFEYLDRSGGFFYERWGDAPVHSIYATLFLKNSEMHFFDEIGYTHDGMMHCPSTKATRGKNCHCNIGKRILNGPYSCEGIWLETSQLK